tara:strand:- start:3471 stop:5381 length:1911 start_codon:yes stop_codon:yes gene_type:complete
MATQWQTFPIEFRGGLISNLTALQQGTNAVGSATLLQNFEVNREGGYSKLKGYSKYSTTEVTGSGTILALKVISSGRIVTARKNNNNKTQYYYGTGTTWSSLGESALTNGGKAKSILYNLDGDDKVIFVDGTNFPAIYNTSGNTFDFFKNDSSGDPYDIGTSDPQGASDIAIFKNTAFYAKGNNLFFTAPFTTHDFNVANGAGSINVANDITGLAVFREQLIIFTTDTIKRLTGSSSSDFQVSPITDRIGCINGDTIQEVGGDIMYLAPDGIRLLSATDRIGDFGLDVASDSIVKDATKFLSQSPIYCSVVLKEKAQYRIFSYIESEQVEAAKGLIATKFISQGAGGLAWSTVKGVKAFIADSRYTSTLETLAFANNDGYIYIMETGSDFNGLPIEAIYESPFMPISDPQLRKTFYKMTLYAEPTANMTLDLNIKYDFASATDTKVVQPSTLQIASTGSEVFFFGESPSIFYKLAEWKTETGSTSPTNGQTSFLVEKVKYNVGTDASRVVVYKNGQLQSGYSVSTTATTETIKAAVVSNFNNTVTTVSPAVTAAAYNTTIVLSSGVLTTDAIEIYVLPVNGSVSNSSKFGGELDKIYNTNIIGSGKTVAIRLEDFSTNPTFTLDTALLEYSQEDRQ